MLRHEPLQFEFYRRQRRGQAAFEGGRPALTQQRIRVMPGGQAHDAHVRANLAKDRLAAQRGIDAGGVGVEDEEDAFSQPVQQLRVLFT